MNTHRKKLDCLDIADGLRLRRWCANDLESLLRHANDEQVSRGLADRFPYPYTRDDGEAFLSGQIVDLNGPVFAIEMNGEACGGIGVTLGVGERCHSAEFGYWLGRTYWGWGIMSRVVSVYAPWVMRECRLYRLQASVFDFNLASAKVLQNNGFVEEGMLRRAVFKYGQLHDLRLFALTRDGLE
jgi:RimJ/RimL family protein N-acetyltransferase